MPENRPASCAGYFALLSETVGDCPTGNGGDLYRPLALRLPKARAIAHRDLWGNYFTITISKALVQAFAPGGSRKRYRVCGEVGSWESEDLVDRRLDAAAA